VITPECMEGARVFSDHRRVSTFHGLEMGGPVHDPHRLREQQHRQQQGQHAAEDFLAAQGLHGVIMTMPGCFA